MEVEIRIYNKRLQGSGNLFVEQLAENKFRMTDNDLLNCTLTKGTEFETRINSEGDHEVIRITKRSEFITRRFLLSINGNIAGYRMLGDELTARGGCWQVDMGGILTVNIPPNFEFDVDAVIREFDLPVSEIVDDGDNIW